MTNGRIITALAVAIALCGLVATTTATTAAAAAAARPGQPIANSHMNVAARRAVEDGTGEDSNSATATTTADQIVEFAWDNSIGHNDFYGEMDAEFGLFGATVGAKFVVQMGKMLAFAEVSLWDVFNASILIDLKVPNMMNLDTYTEGPDFSAKVQGFVSAPGLTEVQDLVVAKMIEAAKGAEQAFNVAADTFATEKNKYETVTLPQLQAEVEKWKLDKREKDTAKAATDQWIDAAVDAAKAAQTHINAAFADYNKLAAERTAFISGVCDGMDTNTEFSKGSTDGCIKKVAITACKIDTCEMPNSCKDPPILIKADVECNSGDEWLGTKNSLAECSAACAAQSGCQYFIFGKGGKQGKCYWEKVGSDGCTDGFEDDLYNFYEVAETDSCVVEKPCRRRRGADAGVPGFVAVPEEEYDEATHMATWNRADNAGAHLGGQQRRGRDWFEQAVTDTTDWGKQAATDTEDWVKQAATDVGECIGGFFTETVTSGWCAVGAAVTGTAECGWEFTAAGAECGWNTIVDATLCATTVTTQCFDTFAGDVAEFVTNPAVFCNALNDGTSSLDQAVTNALQEQTNAAFELATQKEAVAQYKAASNDIIDSYQEVVNQMNEWTIESLDAPVLVLAAAEASATELASAAAAAQRIIAEVADDFDISKIFINVTLSTETAVPSDITLNVFGAELVVPGFSLDFKAAIDQKLEPLDALVDDLAAKAAEAAEQLFTETIPGWVETAAAGIDSVVVGPVQQEIEKLKAELEASLGAERYSVRTRTAGLQVSAGASYCQVDANNCVSDGTGDHGDNEACTINVLGAGTLTATDFNTETGYDYVTIGGTRYSGSTGPSNVAVAAGSTFTWRSDSSITNAGFTICWTPDAPLPFV